jgi:ubiquinone biosynthesis protein UbiJ
MTHSVLPVELVLDGFNRIVAANGWLRSSLQARAGQNLRIEVLGWALGLRISSDGAWTYAPELVTEPNLADTRIRLREDRLDRLLLADAQRRVEAFELAGDPGLAQTLMALLPVLQRELMARMPLPLLFKINNRAVTDTLAAIAGNLSEYLMYESHLLAAPAPVSAWRDEVRRLRDDLARLDARVARLDGGRA